MYLRWTYATSILFTFRWTMTWTPWYRCWSRQSSSPSSTSRTRSGSSSDRSVIYPSPYPDIGAGVACLPVRPQHPGLAQGAQATGLSSSQVFIQPISSFCLYSVFIQSARKYISPLVPYYRTYIVISIFGSSIALLHSFIHHICSSHLFNAIPLVSSLVNFR